MKPFAVKLLVLALVFMASTAWAQGKRWSDYTHLESGNVANDDTFLVLDKSDTEMAATGTQKQYSWQSLVVDMVSTRAASVGGTAWSVDADGNQQARSLAIERTPGSASVLQLYEDPDNGDENIILTPPIRMSLEQAIEFIDEDELVEVTPKNIRIRKKFLLEHERKRASRGSA